MWNPECLPQRLCDLPHMGKFPQECHFFVPLSGICTAGILVATTFVRPLDQNSDFFNPKKIILPGFPL